MLDVFPMETSIDDGLCDLNITDVQTGRSSLVELKVAELVKGEIHFKTLQGSQINWLAERSRHPSRNVFILIEHPQGLFLIKADYSVAWRRAMVQRKCALTSSIGKPVEWSGLALALWPPLV